MTIRTLADVGAAFRQARAERQVTQVELAAKLHTTPGLISRFERGDGNIGLAKLLELFAALDLQMEIKPNDTRAGDTETEDDDEIDLDAIVDAGLKPSKHPSQR